MDLTMTIEGATALEVETQSANANEEPKPTAEVWPFSNSYL